MPTIIIREAPNSRGGEITRDASTQTRVWHIDNLTDPDAVKALLSATAPATILEVTGRILRPQRYKIDPQGSGDAWECSVEYSSAVPDPDWGDWQFSTGGGTHHTTQSKSTRGRYPESATDHKGAIAVTENGVEGVDITSPVYTWSETYRVSGELVTAAYKAALFRLTGKVNNASWRGFEAEEILFQGARGATQGWDETGEAIWELAFEFAASQNAADLTVGDFTGITKKGWDYLWCKYDSDNVPTAVYVEKVYDTDDFLDLGIGE